MRYNDRTNDVEQFRKHYVQRMTSVKKFNTKKTTFEKIIYNIEIKHSP